MNDDDKRSTPSYATTVDVFYCVLLCRLCASVCAYHLGQSLNVSSVGQTDIIIDAQ